MVLGEREWSLAPVWALAVWALGPLAVAIIFKYAGIRHHEISETTEKAPKRVKEIN